MNRALSTRGLVLLLLFLVFAAVGLSPLLSIATMGLAYLVWRVGAGLRDLAFAMLFLGLLLSFLLIAPLLDQHYAISLAALRIAVCFAITFFLMGRRLAVPREEVAKYVLVVLVVLSLAILAQKIMQFAGVYVSMPEAVLAQKGSGTLVDSSRLAFLQSVGIRYYRPSLVFAEPSYFALVVVSLFAVLLACLPSPRTLSLAAASICIAALSSGSGYLVVCAALLFALHWFLYREWGRALGRMVPTLFVLILIGAIVIMYVPIDARLAILFSSGDASAYGRLMLPVRWVGATWWHLSLLGYPIGAIYPKLSGSGFVPASAISPLDNGLFNLLMNFGLGGLFILASMRLRIGGWFGFVYVLLALMQNGTFGSWDKAFIIGLTCVLINSVKDPEAEGASEVEPVTALMAHG